MNGKFLGALKYLLLLLAGLGLLWLAFRNENIGDVWAKIRVADPYWLGASVILAILAFISRAVRWVMLIEPLGYKPRLSITLYALMIGYLANLAVPRIGEITRCASLSKSEKVPFNGLIGTVIVERAIDLLMLFISIALVAILEFRMLTSFLLEKIINPLLFSGSGPTDYTPLYVTGAVVLIIGMLLIRFLVVNKSNRFRNKIISVLKEVGAGLSSVMRMKNNWWFLFHSVFIWVMYFLMTWVCFFCLEATSELNLHAGLFILVVGGLGMSAPVQGGIGAFHYIVSQGLQLFGVSSTDGIAYATLVHTTQTLLVIVLGGLAFLLLFLARSKKQING